VPFDENTVYKLAKLAQLEMTEEDVRQLLPRLQEFMRFVNIVQQVQPTSARTFDARTINIISSFRADEPITYENQGAILRNFPVEEDSYLRIPRIGEEELEA
jgi:aspartyl/glutamyl-tRNA(Asn/Gln) amidotransferase C subunit